MKRLRQCLLVLATFVSMSFGTQAVMAAESGTLENGLTWVYEDGTMAITDCVHDATEIVIPAEINGKPVTLIQKSAFSGCNSLTSVKIPNSVTTVGENAFENCLLLSNMTIPNSVTTIGKGAFRGCDSFSIVTIPNSVTTIDCYTFYSCSSLSIVTIPSSVTTIGESAFESCWNLTTITIPNSVTTIGKGAFRACDLSSVTIPNSITKIESSAFSNCSSLTSVKIPNSVTEIGDKAFLSCENLESVKIPNSVTTIKNHAFGYDVAGSKYIKVPGFTIYGDYGTEAETYALENGFIFVGPPDDIAKAVRIKLIKKKYEYTGAQIKPEVTVTQKSSGKKLKKGVDYTVSYSNNIAPGKGTVTITGKNNYKGTASIEFTILDDKTTISSVPLSVKAKVKGSKVTVSWKKFNKKTSEEKKDWKKVKSIQVQYSTSNKFDKDVVTKKIGKSKTKITLKLKKKTRYYIRVRYLGSKGASEWSKVKKVQTK